MVIVAIDDLALGDLREKVMEEIPNLLSLGTAIEVAFEDGMKQRGILSNLIYFLRAKGCTMICHLYYMYIYIEWATTLKRQQDNEDAALRQGQILFAGLIILFIYEEDKLYRFD